MSKNNIIKAIEKFSKKQLKKDQKLWGKSSRKNKKPEENVKKECLNWMRMQGWHVEIYEAKATFDPRRQVWRNQSMKAGTPDCMGTLPGGVALYVEFKAPGKLKTFNREGNERQVQFLKGKICVGAFGCVTDSVEHLAHVYNEWQKIKNLSDKEAIEYLLEALP